MRLPQTVLWEQVLLRRARTLRFRVIVIQAAEIEQSTAVPGQGQGESSDHGSQKTFFFERDISADAFKKCLFLLFLAGLIIRTAFLLEHARTPSFAVPTLDQVYYDTVAKMLLAGEDLHQLHGFRPLLYPIFLAGCYKLGGSWGPDLAIALQHILGVATGLLVALLGARLFRHRLSGIIGGALFLLAPVPLYFEGELLIEPTYVFLIFVALWLHLEAAERTGWRSGLLWLACGALIVLAAQARANIMVFLAIYPLFAAWRFFRPAAANRGSNPFPLSINPPESSSFSSSSSSSNAQDDRGRGGEPDRERTNAPGSWPHLMRNRERGLPINPSQSQKDQQSTAPKNPAASASRTDCGAILPLPPGEGRGEGNSLGAVPASLPPFPSFDLARLSRWSATLPLCGLLGALLMAVPWGIFNLRQSDYFHLLPNAGGVALYCGNKRGADGMTPEQERRIYSGDRYQDSIETWAREDYESAMRSQGRQPDNDPMAISRYWTQKTLDEIKADPAAWLRLMAKKTWLTFWNAEVPNNKAFAFLQQDYFWLRVPPVRWVILLALAPAGLWAAFRFGKRDALLILFSYAALYSAANIVFFICDRYRYPVWPAAAVFAGGGLVALFELARRLFRRQEQQSIVTQPAFACGIPASFTSVRPVNSLRPLLSLAVAGCVMAAISLPNWFHAQLPSFSRDYMFRSFAWYAKGHFQEALDDINRSVELNPQEASALHHRGNVLFALNRLPEAVAAYEQAISLSPAEAGIWNNLGATFSALGQTHQALQAYRRAMACTPPSRNAFLGAAFLEVRLQRFDEAAASLAQLEKAIPDPDPAALALRSVLARKHGEFAKADTLEKNARQLDPTTASWALQRALEPH